MDVLARESYHFDQETEEVYLDVEQSLLPMDVTSMSLLKTPGTVMADTITWLQL